MKCKPGDLAVSIVEPNRGAFVTVLHACPCNWFTTPAWVCRALQPVHAINDAMGGIELRHPAGSLVCFADDELQPIRGQRQADTPPPAEAPLPKPMTAEPVL